MKNLMILLVFLMLNHSLIAQAKISFENTSVEYNDVKSGSDGTRSFIFTNTGNQPLAIEKIVSTSSSIEIDEPGKSIEPGKKGEIKITYNTKKPGPIRRTITVYSNAENLPIIALKAKGNVVEE